ncbi:efflux RND transporter periplasmic adaptor subunit [Myroides albus]|uniref:Efflux RND transporter periplasmic adaptor subunit n=1 Tax=Myroides albus TaxID=2562892 RepID=A0A6I3LFH3_9FLAO|nr:efflux RND transporter periplasmic adaptor subunit [Myroides albus]MTG98219.1 efflux RND transporter periplasmic adaptor subunit [Myroides albus]UVD79338.1 efflux RND transporter periplasmic adaptor subunit [Myroides albus]
MRKIYRTVKFLIIGGLLLGTTLLTVSCNKQADAGGFDMTPEVKTTLIKKQDATVVQKYTAALEGKVNVEVRAQAAGYIEKILVEEGSFVKKGQALILIDSEPYRIQLQNTEATLKAAKAALVTAELERNKVASLLENSFVSPIQLQSADAALDNAKAVVSQAQAAVNEARLNLSYTTVKAPVDGFLGRINKRVGNLVAAGEPLPLTTLSDISQMYAYFSIGEADYYDLIKENGSAENVLKIPVELELSNGDKYGQNGKVDVINGEFDKVTNALTVRATFPNPDRVLRNGATGIVYLNVVHKDAIQVPISATIDLQEKVFVFVLTKENTVEQRQLKILGRDLHTYFVESGVEAGEVIAATAVDKLQDGAAVKVLEQQQTASN